MPWTRRHETFFHQAKEASSISTRKKLNYLEFNLNDLLSSVSSKTSKNFNPTSSIHFRNTWMEESITPCLVTRRFPTPKNHPSQSDDHQATFETIAPNRRRMTPFPTAVEERDSARGVHEVFQWSSYFQHGSECISIAREQNGILKKKTGQSFFSKLSKFELTLGEVNPLKLFGKSSLGDGKMKSQTNRPLFFAWVECHLKVI